MLSAPAIACDLNMWADVDCDAPLSSKGERPSYVIVPVPPITGGAVVV
ncbi:hypothetical protein SLEP1_g28295 [Rubroshorea leprosula]|uniref:Uncharacterized protein n=1 Tax=Rubroshorea leprosula TaxID=152421 RepID=A0AAV5K1V8_9ROSI|nr:hypothetical protein SLEP1_g28295 [Rubroshorea leprosula]